MNLPAFLSFLRRRLVPIVACAIAGVIAAGIVTASTTKQYRASTRLFITIPAAQGVQEALQGVQLSAQLLESYARIGTSRAAAARVADELDGRYSAGAIRSKLSASPQPDTLLIDITATDKDPVVARDIANAAAKVLSEFVTELEADRAGTTEARVIDPAVAPGNPFSPRVPQNLVLGLLVGLAVGAAVALVLESTDRTLRASSDVAAVLGAPVLVTVPFHRRLRSEPLPARLGSQVPGGEAYRALRTAVRFADMDRPLRTLLVTSASDGEGKSITAANLAVAWAEAGERVVLVDADLRRSRLATILKLSGNPEAGLTSVLTQRVDLSAALQPTAQRLRVLPAGPLPPNPSELLGSEAMASLLETLAADTDVVIIDAPSLLPVTDAAVLATLVDGVLLVVEWGETDARAVAEASQTLERVGARVIGGVLNAARGGSGPGLDAAPTNGPAMLSRSARV